MRFYVRGARVTLSFWFFALIGVVALLDRAALLRYFVVPVLVHECGHAAVMLLAHVPVREVRFSALGIEIRRDPARFLPTRWELCLSLSGILANLLTAALLYLFRFQTLRVMLLVAANIVVALYNALPIGELDGGQAARILTARFFSPDAARAASLVCSLLVLSALVAFTALIFLSGMGNPTLLISCMYLIYHVVRNT